MSTPFVKLEQERIDEYLLLPDCDTVGVKQRQGKLEFLDTAAADIARSLRELTLPVEEGFRLAMQDGQIIGVLGIEADPEIGCAWIYGPLVRHPLWQAVADQLYAAALPAIPSGIGQQQLFCDGRNRNCRDFAARHDFELLNESAIMTLSRADLDVRNTA